MRTNISLPSAILLIISFAFSNYQCKNKDKCDTPIEIQELLPDNNPAGYEIQIKGTGFTQAAVVRFGSKAAAPRWYAEESTLIAEVPDGLSGPVEVTVEEGDCIGRADFEVTSGANADWPSSPTQIVIPQPTADFPLSISNAWRNYYDSTNQHGIQLTIVEGEIELDTFSHEFNFADPKFNDNPVSGTVSKNPNEIHLTIDRTANGGLNDELEGQFIPPILVGGELKHLIWLQSKITGRQLVLIEP